MRAYRKNKSYAGLAKNAPSPQPLDDAQLNSVLRHAFAWMWVGMGITATVAGAMRAHPIYPDIATTVIVLAAQFALAFALGRKLRGFSPTPAVAAFVFYSALTGFTMSTIFSMLYHPTVSDAVVTACVSVAGLFGLMTLIGWRTRLNIGRSRSYALMALLGLLIACLVNRLMSATPFDYGFSFLLSSVVQRPCRLSSGAHCLYGRPPRLSDRADGQPEVQHPGGFADLRERLPNVGVRAFLQPKVAFLGKPPLSRDAPSSAQPTQRLRHWRQQRGRLRR